MGSSRSSLLLRLFSSCSEWGLLSCCGAWALGDGLQQLQPMGSRARAPWWWPTDSCSAACGILPDQVLNPCLVDSLPLSHQGSPVYTFLKYVKLKVTQSCLTLCDPVNYIVHGILQVRILEWVAFPFSRGSSQPRNQTQVSGIVSGFFTS